MRDIEGFPRLVILLVVLTGFLEGAGCFDSSILIPPEPGRPSPLKPIHDVLTELFGKKGFVPYSVPGKGGPYEAGSIIRYQDKAEVLVWARDTCFGKIPQKDVDLFGPSTKWTDETELSGALDFFVPPIATTLGAELSTRNVETTRIAFAGMKVLQLPEGDVEELQTSQDFPKICRRSYGHQRILILGTIAAKAINFSMMSESDLRTAFAAKPLNLPLGGKITFKKIRSGEYTMQAELDEPIVFGYLPSPLVETSEGMATQRLSAEDALRLKAGLLSPPGF